jgi:hypothetical protein
MSEHGTKIAVLETISDIRRVKPTQFKTKVFVLLGLGIIAVGVVGYAMLNAFVQKTAPANIDYRAEGGSLDATEIASYIKKQKPRIDKVEREIERLKKMLSSLYLKTRKGQNNLKDLLNKNIQQILQEIQKLKKIETPAIIRRKPKLKKTETSKLHKIKVKKSRPTHRVHLPAGSYTKGTLLTGCYAPVSGSPMPVLMRLERLACGPNNSRIPVKGAFLIGRAQGDANSNRAIVQFTKMTLVLADGKVIERDINAYVVDSDGLQGLSGKYVYRLNEVAFPSFLAGALSSISEAFAQAEVTRTTTPIGIGSEIVSGDARKFAVAKGLSNALTKISNILEKRLDEINPAIWVKDGKKVSVVFLESVDLMEVEDEKIKKMVNHNPYDGLD